MEENEITKRSQGQHYKKNEIKIEIIKYILDKNDAVPGSEIRNHLREKYGIVNKRNIKDHLEKLNKDHCIEKFDLVADDYGNKWDITKFENLKKIKKYFSEIRLNEYGKSLSLMSVEEIGADLDFLPNFLSDYKLRVQLRVSPKFFDMCLDGDFKTVYSQTYRFYQLSGGYFEDKSLRTNINDVYETFIKGVTITPDIEISKEMFEKMLEENSSLWGIESQEDSQKTLIIKMSHTMAEEIINEMLEKNSNIVINISEEVRKEMSNKIAENVYKTIVEDYPKELYHKIIEIKSRQAISHILCYNEFLKSYLLQDFVEA